jgi:hypothetical protein
VKKLKWLIFFFSAVFHLQAQQLAFRHLDVNDGLSSNVVSLVAFDRNGSLWFSTGESINFFDGNNVFPFHWRNNPVFPQAESGFFSVDSYNRVWICYPDRTILINEKRQPEWISIRNSYGQVFPTHCFDINGLGVVAVSGKGTYYSTDIRKPWNRLAWFDSLRAGRSFVFVNRFDSSSVIIKLSNRLLVVNFSLQKIMLDMEHADATEACRLNDDEILVAARNQWRLYRFSLSQQKIIKTYTKPLYPMIISGMQNFRNWKELPTVKYISPHFLAAWQSLTWKKKVGLLTGQRTLHLFHSAAIIYVSLLPTPPVTWQCLPGQASTLPMFFSSVFYPKKNLLLPGEILLTNM